MIKDGGVRHIGFAANVFAVQNTGLQWFMRSTFRLYFVKNGRIVCDFWLFHEIQDGIVRQNVFFKTAEVSDACWQVVLYAGYLHIKFGDIRTNGSRNIALFRNQRWRRPP